MPHMFIIHMVYYASMCIIGRTKQEFNLKYREPIRLTQKIKYGRKHGIS